ncbi:hypothetical protein ACGFYU_22445 [Streptomyces sp. NPDC048337]|uniref:hypothetical protein n=1 Tax=Streptomyces sp. NPDC048337 TaxID=3365535 RepID=UPI003715FF33
MPSRDWLAMLKKRAARLLVAVVVAGFGLTACSQSSSDTSKDKAASPSAAASAPAAGGSAKPSAAPSATPGVIVNGKQKPSDLPADLPLPQGELTSVTGADGTYVLMYTTPDPASALTSYTAALKSAGFEVDDSAAGTEAVKGKVNVRVTKTPTALQLAVGSDTP